jgi:DNA-binding transcriptional MerR regulator
MAMARAVLPHIRPKATPAGRQWSERRMHGEWTHKDLAKRLGVSVTTIKSYRAKFPGAIAALGQGKPLRFGPQALAACQTIRNGFQRGLSIDEIYHALKKDFPDVQINRHLSNSDDISASAAGPAQDLRGARAGRDPQPDGACPAPDARTGTDVETNRRLERLETMLAELVALGSRTHSLHAELLAKLDALAGLPGVVRAAARPARTGEEAGALPPDAFLDMPVVVRSDRGEYLGITGPGGTAFRLREFQAHLLRRAGRMDVGAAFHAAWTPRQGDWVLTLLGAQRRQTGNGADSDGGAQLGHEHFFRRTTTQKGNLVALFHRLSINGKDVSEAFLRAFFKQIKDSLE